MIPGIMAQRKIDPSPSDPYFANVVSLIHFDEADGSTSVSDVKGISWSRIGNVTVKNPGGVFGGCTNPPANGACFRNIGTAALKILNSEDLTIEFSVKFLNTTNSAFITAAQFNDGSGNLSFGRSAAGVFTVSGPGNTAGVVSLDTWYRIALTRQTGSNTTRLFVDGILKDTKTWSGQVAGNVNANIGGTWNGTSVGLVEVDEWRVTKGVCRYTANYVLDAAPFPNH